MTFSLNWLFPFYAILTIIVLMSFFVANDSLRV